jgi:glutathione S-transferase
MRRGFEKQLHARGMGRHDEKVIVAQGREDLDALAEIIGEGPYLLGDRPSSFDASVFGFLGVCVYVQGDNPLFRHAAENPRLMDYCERLRSEWFPETLDKLPLQVELGESRQAEVA